MPPSPAAPGPSSRSSPRRRGCRRSTGSSRPPAPARPWSGRRAAVRAGRASPRRRSGSRRLPRRSCPSPASASRSPFRPVPPIYSISASNRAREGDDVDPRCPGRAQRRRRGGDGRPGCVDVVDEHDPAAGPVGPKGTANIAASLVAGQTALGPQRPRSAEEPLDGELPAIAELAREPCRRVVPALEAPVAVRWDERDQLCGGRRYDLLDNRGGQRSESADPALLPGGDEGTDSCVVLDARPRRGEREPTAGALAATRDRPRDGSAAACAERPVEPRQGGRAPRAGGGPREGTDDTAAWQEEVEEHTPTR